MNGHYANSAVPGPGLLLGSLATNSEDLLCKQCRSAGCCYGVVQPEGRGNSKGLESVGAGCQRRPRSCCAPLMSNGKGSLEIWEKAGFKKISQATGWGSCCGLGRKHPAVTLQQAGGAGQGAAVVCQIKCLTKGQDPKCRREQILLFILLPSQMSSLQSVCLSGLRPSKLRSPSAQWNRKIWTKKPKQTTPQQFLLWC